MCDFFTLAAGKIGGLAISVGNKILGDKVKDVITKRRMARLVEDAVDRIIAQTDEYLRGEHASDQHKELLVTCLCDRLQPLADEPQKFFAGDLNGSKLFEQCHPSGTLPEAIQHEGLGQFYSLLFPQIAHFLAGTRIALVEWQAEGYREGFRRLSEIAEEIRGMNARVTGLPSAVVKELKANTANRAETLLRDFAQTLLNNLLLKLDLSPLRAERSLYGSLLDHFVVPQFRERNKIAVAIGEESLILQSICKPGARGVVHGRAGVGKTTCALWLQSRLIQTSGSRLVALFRLRTETHIEQYSLLDLLKKQAGTHLRDAITEDMVRDWHEAGRLIIILDGFDEIPETRRDAVETWIKSLSIVVKHGSLIVTSRPLQSGHLEQLPQPWRQWDLLPFDHIRIIDFIKRWHSHLPDSELSLTERQVDAASLAQTFLKDPSLRPLADTPLMLGTLLYVHHRDKRLPSGRVDLYERYIAAMLGLRDSGLGIEARATKLTDRQKRRVLAHIALHFHSTGVDEVNDDTMRQLVSEALSEFKFDETPDCLLPALCERTGLIQGPGAWSFMHKTIGEFLVAELICDGSIFLASGLRLDRKSLWSHRHDDHWTAVLFFWAGKTSTKELEEFAFELAEEDNDEGPLLATALLGDQGERLPPVTQRQLIAKLLSRTWSTGSTTRISIITTGMVPTPYSSSEEVNTIQLRGLTEASITSVFKDMFQNGIISPEISSKFPTNRDNLTISIFWAMIASESKVSIEAAEVLGHLSRQRRALYAFSYSVESRLWRHERATNILEWLEMYPETRGWLCLLLIGVWWSNQDGLQETDHRPGWNIYFGRILWEYHSNTVDAEWLQHSLQWQDGADTLRGDLVKNFCEVFSPSSPASWGLSEQEHATINSWIESLLLRREALLRRATQLGQSKTQPKKRTGSNQH